jgi:hypothetical protein
MGLTMQQASSVKVPQTRAELEAMVARRGELQNQLRATEARRFEHGEAATRSSAEARVALAQRMESLDHRITQLERQVLQLDEAISTAMTRPEVVQGQPSSDVRLPIPPVPPMEGHIVTDPPPFVLGGREILLGELLGGSLLLLVVFVTWRYAVKRFFARPGGTTSDQAHITRLQQSVDAIAVEVERISENQRYLTKVLHAGTAEPVESRARVAERVPPSGSRGL